MNGPIHVLTKTDSLARVSIYMIHERRDNRDARKQFAISSVARRPKTSSHHAIRALAFLIFCLTPLAAQEANHSEIVVDVKTEDLNAQPVAANWLSYNGDYTGQRFSSLEQIKQSNVSQLRAQWVFHAPNSRDMEVTPVVVNGLMLVTAANDVFALDAQTGRSVWHYSRPVSEGLIDDAAQHHNRGVGIWKSRIYAETDNAHLFCLDSRSGNLLWDVAYAEGNKNYGATSAPLVVKDKVIVGTSGGDDGVRGFVAAYEAASGKLAWRFWTIPGPGEPGSDSWPGELYKHGGGTTWMPGTYDPQLNTLYWGTSNPSPISTGRSARATISTPIASSPSTPILASSSGISNSPRTICSTTTPPKRPF